MSVKSGIIGVSYQETSLLKNSLVKARERNNNAIKSINSGKNNLNISGNSRIIIIEEDNLQRCYNKLRENNNKIEKAINDIDYVVRKVKEVDKKCANRIKTIGTSYKVKSSISSVKTNLISLGDKVLTVGSSFIKEAISATKSMYNSTTDWFKNLNKKDVLVNLGLTVLSGVAIAPSVAAIIAGGSVVVIGAAILGGVLAANDLITNGSKLYNNLRNVTNEGVNVLKSGLEKVAGEKVGGYLYTGLNVVDFAINAVTLVREVPNLIKSGKSLIKSETIN